MKRKTGYYWVKITSVSEWEPALWGGAIESWITLGRAGLLEEDGVWEVGEEIVHGRLEIPYGVADDPANVIRTNERLGDLELMRELAYVRAANKCLRDEIYRLRQLEEVLNKNIGGEIVKHGAEELIL
jgi:hypothetical protein